MGGIQSDMAGWGMNTGKEWICDSFAIYHSNTDSLG